MKQTLSYKGINIHLNTSDNELFYKYVNELIEKDKTNYQSIYDISLNCFGESLQTNVVPIFIDKFYQSLALFETKSNQSDDLPINIDDNKIKFQCPFNLIIKKDNTVFEKHIAFNNTQVVTYERSYEEENGDEYEYVDEQKMIYDPVFEKKIDLLNNFRDNILNEVKDILEINGVKLIS